MKMSVLFGVSLMFLCIFFIKGSLSELERLGHPVKKYDGSLSFLVVGDWGRKGGFNQSLVAHQIFPPAFFDVMEHLAVHLPYEAELGGPVHYRWMYPFERFMGYLKGKAKNLARVEGSIVSGSLSQETSHFTDFYFPSKVRTRKRTTKRYDDGGVGRSYPVEGVPDIFTSVGRLGGCIKEVWWANENDRHSAHTYVLLNCEEVTPFETEFCRQVRECIDGVTDMELNKRKDQHFAEWIKSSVNPCDEAYPQWFHELIKGPIWRITSAPMYCTRGYVFHTFNYGNERATANYGVCVRGEVDFYGVLQDIIEVQYPGLLGLRCVLFKCDWFDPTPGRGVRENTYGVDVNQSRRYNKFEPFILASQAEQVTFVPYPRVRTSGITWLSVVKVSPRGTIVGDQDEIPPMQQDHCSVIPDPAENTTGSIFLIDPQNPQSVHVADDTSADDEEESVPDEFSERDEPDDDDEFSDRNDSDEY